MDNTHTMSTSELQTLDAYEFLEWLLSDDFPNGKYKDAFTNTSLYELKEDILTENWELIRKLIKSKKHLLTSKTINPKLCLLKGIATLKLDNEPQKELLYIHLKKVLLSLTTFHTIEQEETENIKILRKWLASQPIPEEEKTNSFYRNSNFSYKNPMDYIFENNLKEIEKMISNNISIKQEGENSPLCVALGCGYDEIAMALVHSGVSLEKCLFSVKTRTMAYFLILNDADIKETDTYGNTALISFCGWDHQDVGVISLFIEKGIDVNSQNTFGNTALHIACREGNIDHVKTLIENGSDIHIKNSNEDTALMYACMNENEDIIRLLLSLGLDINAKNKEGYTSLSMSSKFKKQESMKCLLDYQLTHPTHPSRSFSFLDY